MVDRDLQQQIEQLRKEMQAFRKEFVMMKMGIWEFLKLLGVRRFVEGVVLGFFWELPSVCSQE